MNSFQEALNGGGVQLQPGALDKQLFVHMDRPNGGTRLTYVRLKGKKVVAFVQFIPTEPDEGEPCFSVGWAVPNEFQGSGRAGKAFIAAVKELRHGFAPHGMTAFWLEGVVGAENLTSQKVAEKVISTPVKTGTDSHAGVPIVQYLRRVDTKTQL